MEQKNSPYTGQIVDEGTRTQEENPKAANKLRRKRAKIVTE